MAPSFTSTYGNLLAADIKSLEKLFYVGQDALRKKYAEEMARGWCFEFNDKFTDGQWAVFAVSQGLCSSVASCTDPLTIIAKKFAPACLGNPPKSVKAMTPLQKHAVLNCLAPLLFNAFAINNLIIGYSLQGVKVLPQPALTGTAGLAPALVSQAQVANWSTCSAAVMAGIAPWIDPTTSFFFTWSDYVLNANGTKKYHWFNFPPKGGSVYPKNSITAQLPLISPKSVIGLSQRGNPEGGAVEIAWWLMRKSLAVGLLKGAPWAQGLTFKDTNQQARTLVSPIDPDERALMSDTIKLASKASCSYNTWATGELMYYQDQIQPDYWQAIMALLQLPTSSAIGIC